MTIQPMTTAGRSSSHPASKAMVHSLGIFLFVLLTAVGAQLEIQRYPVPYTLQTWFVLMAGAFLGMRGGAASMFLYLLLGVSGVPVFSQWGFGLSKILGPTGGYLLSFPIAAFVVGYLTEKNKGFLRTAVSMIAGTFVIYLFGTIHLYLVYFHNWADSTAQGLLVFSWWDGIKIITAAGIAAQIRRRV